MGKLGGLGLQNSPVVVNCTVNILKHFRTRKAKPMAKLTLRKASNASPRKTNAKRSGGKKSKANARRGKANGGIPGSGSRGGSDNSDLAAF